MPPPRSTATVWAILRRHGRIYRELMEQEARAFARRRWWLLTAQHERAA